MATNLNKDLIHKISEISDLRNIKCLRIGYFLDYLDFSLYNRNEIFEENLANKDPNLLKIPGTIRKLINLEIVTIKYTNINTIDKLFFDFKNLKEIFLNYNFELTE
jgi:hypothetical protein